MAEKQTHLDGAKHHHPGLISKIAVTVLAVVGPSVVVVLLILTPKSLKIHVTDAFLAQFNLTADNTLHYNLALNISIRNPNKRIGLYYHTIQANAYYDTTQAKDYNLDYYQFGWVSLTPFYQGPKNMSVLSPVFHGQKLSFLETSELIMIGKFNNDTSDGVNRIAVDLNLSFSTEGGRWIKNGHFNPVIYCDLKVPLSSNGKSAASFNNTKCKLVS